MAVKSIREVGDLVARAQGAVVALQDLRPRLDKQFMPPFPVPLRLAAFEEWLNAAKEALRKPKIALSKKLLRDAGIDPTPVPADVLSETERIAALLAKLALVPDEMNVKATSSVGRALTKGLDEADAIAQAFVDLGTSLKPVLGLRQSFQTVCALVLESVPELQDEHAKYVKVALRIRDLLDQASRLGAAPPPELGTVEDLERELSQFDVAFRGLHALLLREGLSDQELPNVEGYVLCSGREAYEAKHADILNEKKTLTVEYDALAKRLVVMGVASSAAPDTVAELREAVMGIKKRLARRHEELVETLGKQTALLVDSIMSGQLPPADVLDDTTLGEAMRKAVSAGFQIKLEAPHEDQ